ncbi:MAG TPA: rRNA maturation RNase YbeY [Prevotellaceae bacterium]|nr:rRNA maturation RNase YbeY [Prevotellaceae bacterium]
MITYSTTGVEMPPIDQPRVTEWVVQVARSYGMETGDIAFIFVSDGEILRINREYVHHDYYTDHIGFDYSAGRHIAGDIFIGTETVASNARLVGDTYMRELHRVIIHGVLHLLGLEDKTPEQRRRMEQAEDAALDIL